MKAEPGRRELARLLPLLACTTLAPPDARAAKGAAELDAGYYLKALLRGPEANRDDEYFSSGGSRLAQSALGPPDERAVRTILDGALGALADASGRPLPTVREAVLQVQTRLRPNDLLVEVGTPTFEFVRELTAIFKAAPPLLATPGARDTFSARFGCAVSAATAHLPPSLPSSTLDARPVCVGAAERELARLRAARLLVGWNWLDAGSLAPLDAEQWHDLAALDRAAEPWSVALEWTGSPAIAPASLITGSQPAQLVPEPVAAAVAAAIRADACAAAQGAPGAAAIASAGGATSSAPPGAAQQRALQWDLLFLESYRETTRIDVTKLSALMQLTVSPAARS